MHGHSRSRAWAQNHGHKIRRGLASRMNSLQNAGLESSQQYDPLGTRVLSDRRYRLADRHLKDFNVLSK